MRTSLALLMLSVLLVSCGPAHIEGTSVPDTPENRELVDTVEAYRKAVETRDVGTVATLVSRRYFENASTTAEASDDYGFEGLIQKALPVLRDNVKKVVYKLDVDSVLIKGREASVFVAWEMTFQYIEGGLEGWATAKDKNRLDFIIEDGRWKIVAGL